VARLFQPDIPESGGLIMSPQCSNGGVTILVVDDEPLVLDMISQELTAQGFAVLEAETGEAALSIIESDQTVDVLFTDIRLPGELDGWRLAAMAHEAKPGLPVIYVTGYNVSRDAAVPGSVFLKKPYRASAIAEIIRTLIGPNPTAAGSALQPAQAKRGGARLLGLMR
jgi:CheY-like chemotaxis protein